MNILVIFTGGTIGSSEKDGVISTDSISNIKDARHGYKLIRRYCENIPNSVSFSALSPYTILSENLSAKELNLLISTVKESLSGGFDGIIVTHGTDTLQYSAAALAFALGDTPIPVVLVSANYPLDDSRSNGSENFEAAVAFIKNAQSGVFVSYRNTDSENGCILSSTHLTCHREGDDAVYDLDGDAFAYYSYSDKTISLNSKISTFRVDQKKKALDFTLCDDPRIAVIDSYPCNTYPYDLNKISAIIIRPYHSATLNTSGENFINFCREVANKGIPMFLTNARSGSVYASSLGFKANKIIELVGSTFPSVYIKLWIALSEGKDIVEFMQSPICDEFHK